MTYLIGVDVGSSDCKVIVINRDGDALASARQSYDTHYLPPGRVEQAPESWYEAACDSIRDCMSAASIAPADVAGLSVDGPAHHVALLDARGEVIRPTIHWSDLRSVQEARRLADQVGDMIFDRTYSQVNPSWTLAQLAWLKDIEPDSWRRLRQILAAKDYVAYRLMGGYQTDVYDAIGIQFFDIHTEHWSQEICDILEFDMAWLPPIMPAASVCGALTARAAEDTGLPQGLPVAVGSGDSVVEAAGVGAVTPGDCIIKLGTAANVNLVTTSAAPSRQTITYRHVVAPHWFTIAPTSSGASTLRWFRDAFVGAQSSNDGYDLIDRRASEAPPGGAGLLFHPYLNGERTPYWDPDLRGNFVGVRGQHDFSHFSRAVLEGVAFSIRDCLAVVARLGEPIRRYIVLGGGARSALWRRIICDILGEPLNKPATEDAAFGAALLAGVATGVYADWPDAVRNAARIETVLEPDQQVRSLYDELFALYQDIARDLAAHNHRLADITRQRRHDGVAHENRIT